MQLNEQQALVVGHPYDRSALVIAGAGSGKTTVIVKRTVDIVAQLSPNLSVQMLTFSNKAAKEMITRLKKLGCDDLDRVLCDTYHSWGIKRLKDDPEGFGLNEGFTLLSDTDTKRSVRALARNHGLPKDITQEDRRRLNPLAWLSTWSLARQAGYDVSNPDNYEALTQKLAAAHDLDGDEIEMAWQTLSGYEREKRSANSVDFDDLLYLPLLRLARDGNYASTINSTIGHVVIDEVQDTNRIQYEIVRRWVGGKCPVTAVGDDDQSIYGWRGAEVSNLRRFVKHFGADQLKLEQNYRSTQSIVNSSTQLIRNNQDRLDKTPFSIAATGSPLVYECCSNSRDMSELISREVIDQLDAGARPAEIAILYRTNRMAMLIEQSLRRHDIPYHVVGGMSLFDRAEVVAVTSALRLAYNPRDVYALKNLTPYIDGVGPGSGYLVQEWLEEDESRKLSILPEELPGLSKARRDALNSFVAELTFEAAASSTAAEFIDWAVHGPMKLLEREKDDQLRERRAEFLKAMSEDITQELAERRGSDSSARWQDVLLDAALREARQSEGERGQITLSTIHRAKGLEWDHVLLAGMSEGLMPLSKRNDLDDDEAGFSHVEEERRLAFVGVTRARQTLKAYHADQYFFPGSKAEDDHMPSRFADELGMSVVDHRMKATNYTQPEPESSQEDDEFLAELRLLMPRGM